MKPRKACKETAPCKSSEAALQNVTVEELYIAQGLNLNLASHHLDMSRLRQLVQDVEHLGGFDRAETFITLIERLKI